MTRHLTANVLESSPAPTISVVIPTFNDGRYLESCVASIESQTLPVCEIIIVDDGSTEESAKKDIEGTLAGRRNVELITQSNAGPSSARNRGLAQAKGQFICFVDVDDRLREDCLSSRFSLIHQKPHLSGVFGGALSTFTDGSHRSSRFGTFSPHARSTGNLGRPNGFPGGLPLFLFRTASLRAVGGLDEELSIMEDFDLILRLLGAGYQLAGNNEPTYLRNMRPDSLSRASASRCFNGTMLFLNKARKNRYFSRSELLARYARAVSSRLKSLLTDPPTETKTFPE